MKTPNSTCHLEYRFKCAAKNQAILKYLTHNEAHPTPTLTPSDSTCQSIRPNHFWWHTGILEMSNAAPKITFFLNISPYAVALRVSHLCHRIALNEAHCHINLVVKRFPKMEIGALTFRTLAVGLQTSHSIMVL